MNKLLFTLITTFIIVCSVTFGVKTLATEQQYLNALGQPLPVTVPQTTPSGNDLLDTLLPSQKNCNYVLLKRYEPFSDVNNSFPGLSGMTVPGTKGQPCINVGGPAVEGLLKILFMTAITIVITLTVVNIAVSGIQYMTQEANVAKKGAAKKRLTDSFIALALGLMSYTILYTVNQQLVNFTFNPASIDATGAIARGNADAVAALAQGPLSSDIVGFEALLAPIITTVVNQYGQPVTSPTGYVNPYTGQPCTPTGVPDYLENPNTPGGGAILSRRASFLASTYQLPLAILDPCVPVSALGANGGLNPTTGQPGNVNLTYNNGYITCSGIRCSSRQSTVFGFRDGNGTTASGSSDNGVGNNLFSDINGCIIDTGHPDQLNFRTYATQGVALPAGFWSSIGFSLGTDARMAGVKIIKPDGTQLGVFPVVDNSTQKLDFTFGLVKYAVGQYDSTAAGATNSNSWNGRGYSFEIIRDYYRTVQKSNIKYGSSTFRDAAGVTRSVVSSTSPYSRQTNYIPDCTSTSRK